MTDNERNIEDILKQYRPIGPSPQLKERIFGSKRKQNLSWLAVAAVIVIIVGIGFHWFIDRPEAIDEEAQLAKIKQAVKQEGYAHQLFAMAQIFENQTGGLEHAKQIYDEIVKTFPNSESRNKAQLRLNILQRKEN